MESAFTRSVSERYRVFGEQEARRHSDIYEQWALAVADDAETCALIEHLPLDKRQPNIVFACARLLGAEPGPYENLRRVLHERWHELAEQVARRSTQTNEPARCGVLLPLLTEVSDGRPLALIELGASAGLCLLPDDWSYRYVSRDGAALAAFGDGDAGEITVTVKGAAPVPSQVPEIAYRAGLDLNPLDAADPETRAWLRTLVWPGQDHRLARLDHALAAAASHPPRVVQGDVRSMAAVRALLEEVPTGAVPVVFHTALFAYLDTDDRERCERELLGLTREGVHWISNEGQGVLPGIRAAVAERPEFEASLRKGAFVVAAGGVPRYQADGHASWIL